MDNCFHTTPEYPTKHSAISMYKSQPLVTVPMILMRVQNEEITIQ